MTEAVGSLVALGFHSIHLASIFAWTPAAHRSSVRVLEKWGFRRESWMRKHMLIRGQRMACDSFVLTP